MTLYDVCIYNKFIYIKGLVTHVTYFNLHSCALCVHSPYHNMVIIITYKIYAQLHYKLYIRSYDWCWYAHQRQHFVDILCVRAQLKRIYIHFQLKLVKQRAVYLCCVCVGHWSKRIYAYASPREQQIYLR